MDALTRGTRIAEALAGIPQTPPVAGLSFATPELLASVAPGCVGERCFVDAAAALALDFVFAPAGAPWARPLARLTGGAGIFWVVDGPVWPVISRPDPAEGLKTTLRDPASLRPALEAETARAAEELRLGIALGCEVLVIAEDLAGSGGPLVDDAFAAAEVFPRLEALVSVARAARVPAVLHSDGDVRPLLPAIRHAGFTGIHCGGGLERDGFERLFWDARREGLAVVGGIATASLDVGSHAAVRAGTGAALLAHAGGLLVADDGGISTAGQVAAFATSLAAARGAAVPPR
jgi:hypothetical protein